MTYVFASSPFSVAILLPAVLVTLYQTEHVHEEAAQASLVLERLEDRLTPTTFSRLVDVDGYASDPYMDGTFDSVNTTSTALLARNFVNVSGQANDRSILEFNIAGLSPTAQVTSARLYGYVRSLGYEGTSGLTLSAYGYTGNGVVSVADAVETGTQIGQLTNFTTTGIFYIDLDTQFVQSMLGSTYVGIMLKVEGTAIFSFDSREYTTSSQRPTLNIEYDAPLNQAPTANNDSYTLNEDSPLFVSGSGVVTNDSDPEGNTLTASLVSHPSHGTVTFYNNGSFYYTPTTNYNGPDSFTYRVYDGTSYSNTATVNLTVTPVNDAPKANSDSFSMSWNSTLTVNAPGVMANDTDAEGASLTASLFTGPVRGNVTLNSDGSFVYTPNAGYYGTDSFTYRVNDGSLNSMSATVTITVVPPHQPPTASNDSYTVTEDGVLNVAAAGVLSNDSDPEGQALSAVLYTGPLHGTVTLSANGSFVYTPHANYRGTDSFRYRASDGELVSGIATVNLTVSPVNDVPVANNDSYTLDEDGSITVGVTAGITTLRMQSQTGDYIGQGRTYYFTPQTGTFSVNRNYDNGVSFYYSQGTGVWWYVDFAAPYNATLTPGDYLNATRWPFQSETNPGLNVSGEGRGSNTLTGSFTVHQASYLANGTVDRFRATFEQHSEGTVPALTGEIDYFRVQGYSGILQNDVDADGDPLSAILVSGPANGSLTLNADGTFTYTPNANFSGVDSFTYRTSDGTAPSNVATVTFNVNPVNDAPVAVNDAYSTSEGAPLVVSGPGVLGNDSDLDGDDLSAVVVNGPSHGSLSLNADGSFTYTPDANYNGEDSFTYKASDGSLDSAVTTVSLTVTPVNVAPVAADDAFTVAEDGTLTVAGDGVLENDNDADGDALTVSLVTGPSHGSLNLNSDGSFTYTPDANYHGGDSFTYEVSDGSETALATVSLTVTSVNDAPVTVNDSFSLSEDGTLNVTGAGVLANDSDLEGDALTVILVNGPSHGSLNLNSDGSFTYTPAANYHGSDSFTYKVSDGSVDSGAATVSLTVAAVNDAPVAVNDSFSLSEDGTLTVAGAGVLANDSDPDGDPLSVSLESGPSHGDLSFNADGSFTYTPDANYNGSDSFTYKVSDGSADSVATVVLSISGVNDAPVANAGADALNGEGSTFTFDGRGSSDLDGDALSYHWDFGDGSTATGAVASHAHANSGTYLVTLTVSDGLTSTTDTMVLTVVNAAPQVFVSGPGQGVRGQTRTFTFSAVDPSPVDQQANFTYWINWGDGTSTTEIGSSSVQLDHVYAATGTYAVRVAAVDKDGGVSSYVYHTITISTVQVQDDDLVVGGTAGSDSIVLRVANTSGAVTVLINGATMGTYNVSGQIHVYAQAGIDNVLFESKKFGKTTYFITDPAVVFGGDGNDTLDARGSTANNILVGGGGNDLLYGGSSRDILIGGLGSDTLRGGGGEDVLVGSVTTHDDNLDALLALMSEWGRTDLDYTLRADHLLFSPGGNNGDTQLNPSTVLDDGALDQLYGEAGGDLFLLTGAGATRDKINDLAGGEWNYGF